MKQKSLDGELYESWMRCKCGKTYKSYDEWFQDVIEKGETGCQPYCKYDTCD